MTKQCGKIQWSTGQHTTCLLVAWELALDTKTGSIVARKKRIFAGKARNGDFIVNIKSTQNVLLTTTTNMRFAYREQIATHHNTNITQPISSRWETAVRCGAPKIRAAGVPSHIYGTHGRARAQVPAPAPHFGSPDDLGDIQAQAPSRPQPRSRQLQPEPQTELAAEP
jgi:hypothetical protein